MNAVASGKLQLACNSPTHASRAYLKGIHLAAVANGVTLCLLLLLQQIKLPCEPIQGDEYNAVYVQVPLLSPSF